jgi:enamine deaminase RidA (YjgF/YER057c/UK114 family)
MAICYDLVNQYLEGAIHMSGPISIHPGPRGPNEYAFLSQAVRAGDFVFVSGNVGHLPGYGPTGEGSQWLPGKLIDGGIEAETRQTLANIEEILRAAGGDLTDVVKVNSFLRDVDRDFHAYNKVYAEHFPERPPARTTVQAKIYGLTLVEIECTAYIPLIR